ncbi:MAG: tetratricopeptide repeat protein [Gammaproteobacteria bacterium]|nr:tetratricopeptide repeat protein [Gammaproteobacteria bacterium]NIR97313.1 tetratricopeptide repeat protein [Gammaproteobacteria bacterium]NIT63356.1 tetratricopeptide repeat protein [Gammaproteobacteria bacterium]NIV20283.1 tetratricopeptide repeat protein [Gammaproteobacteria bacterium]NIX10700.1 tetratricopeptide repeat protein [Gammaproteobacteria bacterium]
MSTAAKGSLRRRDRRALAVVLTAALVFGGGWLIQHLPGDPSRAVDTQEALPTEAQTGSAWFPNAGDRSFDRARHAREEQVRMRFRQAIQMLNMREYAYAATALHQVLQLAPRMPEAHVNMGFALLGLERPDAARDFFQGAIELRPQQANAYYGLAEALRRLDDVAGAVGAMRVYVHLSPPQDPHLDRARALLAQWENELRERKPGTGGPNAADKDAGSGATGGEVAPQGAERS